MINIQTKVTLAVAQLFVGEGFNSWLRSKEEEETELANIMENS